MASKTEKVFYDNPINSDLSETQNQSDLKYRVILPIPPTLFEIFKKISKHSKELEQIMFRPIKAGDSVQI